SSLRSYSERSLEENGFLAKVELMGVLHPHGHHLLFRIFLHLSRPEVRILQNWLLRFWTERANRLAGRSRSFYGIGIGPSDIHYCCTALSPVSKPLISSNLPVLCIGTWRSSNLLARP